MINIGAYVAGSNAEIDRALALQKALREFLTQAIGQGVPATKSWEFLERVLNGTGK